MAEDHHAALIQDTDMVTHTLDLDMDADAETLHMQSY